MCHSFETDHAPDFKNINNLETRIKDLRQRLFLEAWHTKRQQQPLNGAASLQNKYLISVIALRSFH